MSNPSKKRILLKETLTPSKQSIANITNPNLSATSTPIPTTTPRPPSSASLNNNTHQNATSNYFAMQRYVSPMKPVRVLSGRHSLPTMKSINKTRSMLEQIEITKALEFISHKLSSSSLRLIR